MKSVLKEAMPIGSRWSVYNHMVDRSLGERTVKAHRPKELVFTDHNRNDAESFLTYPEVNNMQVVIEGYSIIIKGPDTGRPILTYMQVTE